MAWFWCTRHDTVEPDDGCPPALRLGPYGDFAEAAMAMHNAHERSDAWDKDPKWNDK